MSHELEYPELVVEPDYYWDDTISISNFNYFNVPSIPQWAYSEYDGLYYEGVQYSWDEVDYRLTIDYNSVPEPADAGLLVSIALGGFILYKIFMKKGTTQMKCSICKTKDSIISFIKSIYNKLTGGK
tara:strand:+ start:9986 stop:10366 length:381 start_codon:yes stop_codon:yes gene_type:complete